MIKNIKIKFIRVVSIIQNGFSPLIQYGPTGYSYKSKLYTPTSNIIRINGAFNYSKASISGTNNTILLKGHVHHSLIRVFGKDNCIVVEDDTELANLRIIIRGNGCKVTIGKRVSCGSAYVVCMGVNNYVHIQDDCMLAEDVDIWATDAHPIYNSKGTIINNSKHIIIDNHVWLCKGAKLLKGVHVGSNSVIGMGCLVTKDIPANVLCAGVPATIIKENINWENKFIEI